MWTHLRIALSALAALAVPAGFLQVVSALGGDQMPDLRDVTAEQQSAARRSNAVGKELTRSCKSPVVPAGFAATQHIDVDGDGCPERVSIAAGRIDVAGSEGVMSFALGSRGDQVLVGDWDCDGTATALLYRPATGAVYRYDRWPQTVGPEHPVIETAATGGRARRRTEDGCHRLEITTEP